MPGQAQQKAKKGKNRRKPKSQIAHYWNHAHVPNMVKRAFRVRRYWIKVLRRRMRLLPPGTSRMKHSAGSHMDRFISQHENGCKACKNILAAHVKRAA